MNTAKTPAAPIRNPIAVAMGKRYANTGTIMKDRRLKRQNRKSWRKEEY